MDRTVTLSTLFLLFYILLTCSVLASTQERYVISMGGSTVIAVKAGTDVLVSDNAVARAKLLSNEELVIKAVGMGETDLWLKSGDARRKIQVSVVAANKVGLSERIRAIEAIEDGLKHEERNGVIVLSGGVSERSYEAIEALVQNNPTLLNLTVLEASEAPMLTLRVNILETKRQALEDIGVRWQGVSDGPSFGSAISGLFEWELDIGSQLMFMKRQGLAKLLAHPTLSTQSGEQASFLAGGELPIPQVVAQGMQDVTFREYGIRLVVEPEVLRDGRIKTRISAELSNIDPAVSVSGIPGILTRRTESVFLSEDGDTMVLSGLLNVDKSSQSDGLPGLSQLNGLEHVFGSEQHRQQTTELVIMVTAEQMASVNQRHKRQKERLKARHSWFKEKPTLRLRESVYENRTGH